eukprot:TRINITY_DN3217_c1_g1_i1.p2 TRINITY_DN3217_c1_g1~~TRINITY_DN3217_c1_g1_i1.p2  ORF type:complete len:110 (+),score=29.16 TRINITY_DN3217_c1_g1_i1:240-569(+)
MMKDSTSKLESLKSTDWILVQDKVALGERFTITIRSLMGTSMEMEIDGSESVERIIQDVQEETHWNSGYGNGRIVFVGKQFTESESKTIGELGIVDSLCHVFFVGTVSS